MFFGWTFLTTSFVMVMLSVKHDSENTVDYTFHFNADKHNVTGNPTGPQYAMTLTSGMLDHSTVKYTFSVHDTATAERKTLCSGVYDHDDLVNMGKPNDAAKRHGKHSRFVGFISNVAQITQQGGYAVSTSGDQSDMVTTVNANDDVSWNRVRTSRAVPGVTDTFFSTDKARAAASASGSKADISDYKFALPCEAIRTTEFSYTDYFTTNSTDRTIPYDSTKTGYADVTAVNRFIAFLMMINPGKATTSLASGMQAGVDALNHHGPNEKCDNDMIYDSVSQAQDIANDFYWFSIVTYILATILGLFYILDMTKLFFNMFKTELSYGVMSNVDEETGDAAKNSTTENQIMVMVFFLVSVFTTILIGLMFMQYDQLEESLKHGLDASCADHTVFDAGLDRTTWFAVTGVSIAFYGIVALSSIPAVWTGYCVPNIC